MALNDLSFCWKTLARSQQLFLGLLPGHNITILSSTYIFAPSTLKQVLNRKRISEITNGAYCEYPREVEIELCQKRRSMCDFQDDMEGAMKCLEIQRKINEIKYWYEQSIILKEDIIGKK